MRYDFGSDNTAGMAPAALDAIVRENAGFARAYGADGTTTRLEHDMTFVRQISQDRKVTVLHQGHVLCEGPVDQVQNDERVIEVYLGRKSKTA